MSRTEEPVPIVVVGAGKVGRALGTNLSRHGYPVTYAVRDLDADLPDGATAVPVGDAAQAADLVVLAVPFDVAPEVVRHMALQPGTVLVDATNPFGRPLPDGVASGAELVQQAAGPAVHVVKAFNVLGAEHMADPVLPDRARPLLPVAGDDDSSRSRVVALAEELGFDSVDVGGLDGAHLLEEAARYWGLLAFAGGRGRNFVLVAHERRGSR
jgi:hypothetical protein